MPRMDFDKGVPLCEQRRRVALAKFTRKHPKRHRTKRRSAKLRAKAKSVRLHMSAMNAKAAAKRKARAVAYWTGVADELN